MRLRELAYLAIATWWSTVLITQSELFRPLRELADRTHPKLGYLTRCSWCAGTWAGFGLTALFVGPLRSFGAVLFIEGLAVKGSVELVQRNVLNRLLAPR